MAKYSLSDQSANRVRKSVQYTELVGADHRQPTAPSGTIPVGGGGQGQLVEIVSNDGAGNHTWRYLKWNGTAWSQNLRGDADDGKAIGIRGENFPAGTRGLVLPWTIDGGGTLLVFLPVGSSGQLFPVTLTFDTGANGDATHAPAFTYKNPTDPISGAEIIPSAGGHYTGLAPIWGRSYGLFNSGTHGTAYFDSAGVLKLYQVDETEQACT